ncbi:MAG: LrgB family protein [Pseudomonadota bacterium]
MTFAALAVSALCIAACVLAWLAGQRLWRRLHHHPLAHPLVTATVPLVAVLVWLDMPVDAWRESTQLLYWLLGPTVVAIAVPVYRQRRTILHALKPVLLAVTVGGIVAPLLAVLFALPFAPTRELLLSLAPKSVTSAIAFPVAQITGGNPELAAGIVIVTGVVGGIVAPWIFRALRITDGRIQGLVLGVVAHAVGTARAIEMGQRPGAFAGVGLALTGLLTALVLPVVVALLG